MANSVNDAYKTGVKREVINALKPFFGADFPYPHLAGKVTVTLDYPMERIRYPAIYVTFNEQELRSMGVGHSEIFYDENDTPRPLKRWFFKGTINFNILALNAPDRDALAASLVNMLAFGDQIPEFSGFLEELVDSDYVDLTVMTERIIPGGEQTGAVPWGTEDELQFGTSYSVAVYGEFVNNVTTGELVQISAVEVWPYEQGRGTPHWTD